MNVAVIALRKLLHESDISAAFDDLKRRSEALLLSPEHDNEATRHDRLVVPVLTHPLLLGWDLNDLVGQASISIPKQVFETHIFRDSTPKFRKPDILVSPSELQFNALVVEEKARQQDVVELNGYRLQLHEYQTLFECVWGLLTDGDRWILKKNLETFHEFSSLDDLRLNIRDIRNCIGKSELLQRKKQHGTCDPVIYSSLSQELYTKQIEDDNSLVTNGPIRFLLSATVASTLARLPDEIIQQFHYFFLRITNGSIALKSGRETGWYAIPTRGRAVGVAHFTYTEDSLICTEIRLRKQ